ncbi:uncharacterized protein LOC143044373 [Mytilus galloprovincialis]|uniref:uncharacterized protein LOC143044373 n=1 Tax=Mytilus galloprovincialis TaxID=29158 RepID=UPI003F7C97B6
MAASRSTCGTVMLVAGTCFTILTLIFVAISFATDYWISYTVKRDNLPNLVKNAEATNGRYTFSRNRGLFRECYPNASDAFLSAQSADVSDGECFKVDLDIPDATADSLTNHYISRIHLLRSCIAFIAVGLFLILVTFIVGLIPLSCSRRSKWAFTAGFLAFLVAFFVAGGMAFFHGAEYLEKRKITDSIDGDKIMFYQSWPDDIKINTDSDYDWSYALGWVGVGCAIITAIFYVIAGFYVGDERYEDREYLDKSSSRGRGQDYAMGNGYDNRAFPPQMMDRPYPGAYPYPGQGYPVPPPPMAYPQGPYVQDLDNGRQLQPMPYWSWS